MYILKTDGWYVERATFLAAGVIVFSATLLAWLHSPWWLLLTGFAGFNLMVLGVTGFCMMSNILMKLGLAPRLGKKLQ